MQYASDVVVVLASVRSVDLYANGTSPNSSTNVLVLYKINSEPKDIAHEFCEAPVVRVVLQNVPVHSGTGCTG
jgi:hypothetical protein